MLRAHLVRSLYNKSDRVRNFCMNPETREIAMNLKNFLAFVGPSVLAMVGLIAVPLLGVAYLSIHSSHVETELVEVKSVVPLFGGLTKTTIEKVPQPVLDENGHPIKVWEYVGGRNFDTVADPGGLVEAVRKDRSKTSEGQPTSFRQRMYGIYRDVTDVDFWGALEFTLLYAFITTPFILVLGFILAVLINNAVKWARGPLIFCSLLPHIITPVVGSLSIYWLFLDNAIVAALLEQLGAGKVYFLKDAFSIRTLIILYGVWHTTPFAFVILYAGLQTVPQDALQAAEVDGANYFQRVRFIIIPHLTALFSFIILIHLMDAYRIFEPVLVFGSNLFANSLQYLTYYILNFEDNYSKAAASAVLTVMGICILLLPILRRTYREQKGVA
jgi:multiple sugar transport system permease protein